MERKKLKVKKFNQKKKKNKKIYRWKFLRKGMVSVYNNLKWIKNKWNKVEGKLVMCENGLHCSKEPCDAFSYIPFGEILAKVECRGKHLKSNDKECWEEQRVVKAYKWTKKDSVALAIFSAELVIDNFERVYPEDKRPREAIEAAKKWLKNPTEENRFAARAAAGAAYETAIEAARADDGAPGAAARVVNEAVRAAGVVAKKKIRAFFRRQVKKLKKIY